MSIARISITIPASLVKQADREARRRKRSRSWLIAEAVQRYLTEAPSSEAMREPPSAPYASGLGEQRLAQLRADLRLTPEARVKEAERTARAAQPSGHATYGRVTRVVGFERYEDYLDDKRREDAR
ncbi:MAG: ribbon-helix-helix protein, CopG family [Gemmatimonadaceae bacterium]